MSEKALKCRRRATVANGATYQMRLRMEFKAPPRDSLEPKPQGETTMENASKRRFVTVVYEIVDDAKWRSDGNPLNYEHHGLKSVCVSAGDLATFIEEIEAFLSEDAEPLTDTKFDELYGAHVRASLPGGIGSS